MNVKIENVEKNVIQLEIEVDASKFEEAMKKSFLKNSKKFNIPGFRKGKAPRNMVERFYGEGALFEDAFELVYPEAYDAAVIDNKLEPVEKPALDIKQIGKGQSLIFTAKVTVKPEVELGLYKGVEITKKEANVTDEEVEAELNKVVEKNSRLITIDDRAVENGDTALIDFEGFVDDVAFPGGSGEDFNLVIGSNQFIPGFEEQLIGALTGDTLDVNVTFPEDYGKEDLKGKPALFKVRVKEIKRKELPALDDEFAKDVSEFDTLDEYKADLKKKLYESAENKAKHDTEEDIIKKVAENATVDVPYAMIARQIDRNIYDLDNRLRYQGLDLSKYISMMGLDVETLRKQFEEKSKNEVLTQLVIEKVSKVEEILATEDEVNEEIVNMAARYKEEPEHFKTHLTEDDMEYIRLSLTAQKTIDFLVDNANII